MFKKLVKLSSIIFLTLMVIFAFSSVSLAQPEVWVEDIYTPTSLVAYQDTTFPVEIWNYGDSGYFWLDWYIDGEYFYSFYIYMEGLTWGVIHVTLGGGMPDGYHTVMFCAYSCREEGWTWTGTPDLEAYDIYTPTSLRAGESTTITGVVQNIGNAWAEPFYVDMFLDDVGQVYWYFEYGLEVYYYAELSVTYPNGLTNGVHTIEYYADLDEFVYESNEWNNDRVESFTWTGGQPDLELTDIHDPTSLISGTDTTITAEITNLGYADANPFYMDVYVDGDYIDSLYFSQVLPARTYALFNITFTGGFVNGTHSIEYVADSFNDVSESNEFNNERTESWTWIGGVADLEFTDIYDPTSLVAGADTTITGEITNWGYAGAGPFYMDINVDGDYIASAEIETGLPARSYGLINVTFQGGFSEGPHDIEYVADSFNDIPESNESNNRREESWTWEGLTCSSTYGSGWGLTGYQSHIDTCEDGSNFYLSDQSRRLGQGGHSHFGLMGSDATIETSLYGSGILTDPDNFWGASNQESGVDANVYAADTYDYFLSTLSLNSFDDRGSSMKSVVENPSEPNNAFWDGSKVNYGVGQGQKPFAGALDVVAHEWGHGVTEYASNLNYQDESGALNEAFSDWIGTAVEHAYGENNWTIGENINIGRDLSNPPNYSSYCNGQFIPQPDHMSGYINCNNDSGGVHLNSGIPNKMFYLLSEGGTHNNVTVQGITIEKAIQIAYRANKGEWPNNATFQKALEGMIKAAEDLYGLSSNEVYQVQNAWAAVGVGTLPLITTSASPLAGGATSGDGSYSWGSSATVRATPNQGYDFVDWTENNTQVSTSASYAFTVNDNRTLVANFVIIPNPPVADFMGSPTSGVKPLTVQFTNQSTGTITTYGWDFGDGEVSTFENPSHTYTEAGDYTVTLTVTGPGGSDTETKPDYIHVDSLNIPPVADPDGPYSGIEGQAIILDGSGSIDPDGTIVLYQWDINNDGTYDYSSFLSTQSHTYAQQGTYTIKLRVTDNLGATNEATTTAIIADTLPTAIFTGSPTNGLAPLTVNFTNSSTGYDQPLSYAWDFDNNGSIDSTLQNPSYTYSSPGIFSVKLTVTDADGDSNTLIRTDYIHVSDSNQIPSVEVIYPNGNELWTGLRDIVWWATDPDEDPLNIDIDYKLSNEPSWTNIVTQEENDGIYSWDSSAVSDDSNYEIRISAYDGIDQGEDQSDLVFEVNNNLPTAAIMAPLEGGVISGIVDIIGIANHLEFKSYIVEYGIGRIPTKWFSISESMPIPVIQESLAKWDVYDLEDGIYTLRLTVTLTDLSKIQDVVHIGVNGSSVINVPDDYSNIQAAINAAIDGETILVDPGTYLGDIDFSGKSVRVVKSERPGSATIDGKVVINSGETSGAVLDGFYITDTVIIGESGTGSSPIIQNCELTPSSGTAFIIGEDSTPQILNNVIQDGDEGIVVNDSASPQILSNVIKYFTYGLLVHENGKAIIQNNTIAWNGLSLHWNTGGLIIEGNAEVHVVNNTFFANQGSTVYLNGETIKTTFINNIFDISRGGRFPFSFYCFDNAKVGQFHSNNVYPYPDNFYCEDVSNTFGFMQEDSQFEDRLNDNFYLKDSSPCIDVGDSYAAPLLDADGNVRYDHPAVENKGIGIYKYLDIGAFEYQYKKFHFKEIFVP